MKFGTRTGSAQLYRLSSPGPRFVSGQFSPGIAGAEDWPSSSDQPDRDSLTIALGSKLSSMRNALVSGIGVERLPQYGSSQ